MTRPEAVRSRAPVQPLDKAPAVRDQQWLLTLLPAFPLLLLVLRLWYLSRQNLQTMLVLVQYVSPLGLVSTLLITLVWIPPTLLLVSRALGALLQVSAATDARGGSSWLVRASQRIPTWVVGVALLMAALTWQMRFLPMLLMLTVTIVGLGVRQRHPDRRWLVRLGCLGLPVAAALLAYAWLAPAIVASLVGHEPLTAVLLMLPPALGVLLTGPIPLPAAKPITHSVTVAAVLLAPLFIGAIFLRTPILPVTAVEVDADPHDARPAQIMIGHVITVDDRMTTLLDQQGDVQFVLNEQVISKTLCPDDDQIPASAISVHGWQVERTMLAWIAPSPRFTTPDPRCEGRPRGQPA